MSGPGAFEGREHRLNSVLFQHARLLGRQQDAHCGRCVCIMPVFTLLLPGVDADPPPSSFSLLTPHSAHLSPPFIGQGLNSGFRDAIGLSWRLARILKGQSEAKLMHSYSLERRKHTQHLIDIATGHGDLICELNPERANELVSAGEPRQGARSE